MAKKLFGKKSKKLTPAQTETVNAAQPVITQLSALAAGSPLKKRVLRTANDSATILGGGGLLGQ